MMNFNLLKRISIHQSEREDVDYTDVYSNLDDDLMTYHLNKLQMSSVSGLTKDDMQVPSYVGPTKDDMQDSPPFGPTSDSSTVKKPKKRRTHKRKTYTQEDVLKVLTLFYVDGTSAQKAGATVDMPRSTAASLVKQYKDKIPPPVKNRKRGSAIPKVDDHDLEQLRQMHFNKYSV
ncbi:hypothetical protein BC941DRAFT_441552 [Chlamydoabsidia padenii]|nr:hypothetical protein BC941DRAFT_441552 [Chlamydoabsidia padenii]